MIVADTNVVSEFMRDRPHPQVEAWARTLEPRALTVSVITVEEIERGLQLLPRGRRRQTLRSRWERHVSAFEDVILLYDVACAQAAAAASVESQGAGRPMSAPDAQIAGICLAGGHTLATRNLSDFEAVPGLELVDPFA